MRLLWRRKESHLHVPYDRVAPPMARYSPALPHRLREGSHVRPAEVRHASSLEVGVEEPRGLLLVPAYEAVGAVEMSLRDRGAWLVTKGMQHLGCPAEREAAADLEEAASAKGACQAESGFVHVLLHEHVEAARKAMRIPGAVEVAVG